MESPGFPDDEVQRLEALKTLGILDTPPEERFDRLTRMARRMFEVPIALVSLVDKERQWFKSHLGLDATETARDISFCGHAILGDDVFVIEDTARDERFADNPLVLGKPYIRFYAGCPIRAIDGRKMGTICLIDTKPRQLNPEDIEILRDLGAVTEREIGAIGLALSDELTSVFNRRGFMANAQQMISFSVRQNLPVTFVYFDLNNFKQINDTLGHAEGDRALITFADMVKSVLRNSDLFARVGGDEFVILLMNTSKNQAEEVVSRISDLLDHYNNQAVNGYDISFAHGVVDFEPDRHKNVEALLNEADAIMYKQKHSGQAASELEM